MTFRRIPTGGITYLERLPGSPWAWGTDYTSGDLYEAEDLYRNRHRIQENRLILVHAQEGRVAEPVRAKPGQYFGRPAWDGDRLVLLLADFPAGEVRLLTWREGEAVKPLVTLPRGSIPDCYNLMPHTAPLCLTRQAENRFQLLWPEKADFPIAPQETFCLREGETLVFSRWYEDPDYREEVVLRNLAGEVIDRFPGCLHTLETGENWLLG